MDLKSFLRRGRTRAANGTRRLQIRQLRMRVLVGGRRPGLPRELLVRDGVRSGRLLLWGPIWRCFPSELGGVVAVPSRNLSNEQRHNELLHKAFQSMYCPTEFQQPGAAH